MTLLFAKYNMICCSETWLSQDFSDSFVEIPGKKVFRSDRFGRGGGVCIYMDSIIAPYCEVVKNHSYCCRDFEIISIVKKTGHKQVFVSTIYRPPRGYIIVCIDRLQEIFSMRPNLKEGILAIGRFQHRFF